MGRLDSCTTRLLYTILSLNKLCLQIVLKHISPAYKLLINGIAVTANGQIIDGHWKVMKLYGVVRIYDFRKFHWVIDGGASLYVFLFTFTMYKSVFGSFYIVTYLCELKFTAGLVTKVDTF